MGGGISCLAYIIVLRYLPQMKCWSGGRRIYSPSKNPKTRHHCNIPIYSNVCKPSLFLTREIYSCQMCIVTMWAAGLWPSHENKKHFGYVVHWEVLQVDFAIQLRWSEEHWGGGWDSNRSLQWTADGKHEGGATKATFHPPDMLQLYHGATSHRPRTVLKVLQSLSLSKWPQVQLESTFWMWLPVSFCFATSFHFGSTISVLGFIACQT